MHPISLRKVLPHWFHPLLSTCWHNSRMKQSVMQSVQFGVDHSWKMEKGLQTLKLIRYNFIFQSRPIRSSNCWDVVVLATSILHQRPKVVCSTPKYHLIWTDLSKIAIEQKANEIQNHLGYIKGRKGFALRFLTTDAADGFKNLFPHKTFEPPVSVNALYRLQPVPFGILPEVLTEACKAIKWNIKPIKRSGNSWLVGADKQSPNKFLIIDGTTILVKEVEKTNNGKSSIFLAGPRPKPTGERPRSGSTPKRWSMG